MNIKDIILIIPNFNQLTYLRNLINWWLWYHPNNPVVVLDNGSTYEPLKQLYLFNSGNVKVLYYETNDFVGNLKQYLATAKPEWYVISDPDIMPHPATPFNFLEVLQEIVKSGYHHAGFDLITNDLPKWNAKAGWIQGDEAELKRRPVTINYEGVDYPAHQAPIDTTFALYWSKNGGWDAPMPSVNWDNSIRIFQSFHMAWYLDPDRLPEEMKYYYDQCLRRDDSKPSAGRSHYNPFTGMY